jgi:hypothetical protein
LELPSQAQAWARSQGFLLLSDLLGQTGGARQSVDASQAILQMISPAHRSVYRLAANLDASAQRIHLAAASQANFSQVTLWLDGQKIASFSDGPPYESWVELTPGEHQVWAEGSLAEGNWLRSNLVNFSVELSQ